MPYGSIDFYASIGLFLIFFYMLAKHSSSRLHKTHLSFLALAAVWPMSQFSVYASGVPYVQAMVTALAFVSLSLVFYGWLWLAILLASQPDIPGRKLQIALFVPVAVSILAIITNSLHGWFFSLEGNDYSEHTYGPMFWFLFAYATSYTVAGGVIAARSIIRKANRSEVQFRWLLAGFGAMIASGMADVYFNVIVYPKYGVVSGLTSLGLLGCGICFSVALGRYKFADKNELSLLEEMRIRNQALTERNELLKRLSVTDDLTGLYNRRYFYQHLMRELDIEQRYKTVFSILLIDVDYFKAVNDTYGHQVGDAILVQLSKKIKCSLRRSDVLARIGGEEFALYLPHTDVDDAEVMAGRIRELVRHKPFDTAKGSIPVTISIGLISSGERHESPGDLRTYLERLLEEVDAAMYRAKTEGRNRIISAGKV